MRASLQHLVATDSSLDPVDWERARALGHRMVDDAINYLMSVRERAVWTPIGQEVKETYLAPLPQGPQAMEDVYDEFSRYIFPFASGNIHPRFFAWVHGTGTITGAFADFMASVMNTNCAIGDHSAMYVDRQVVGWCKEIMGFPESAGGLLVSGGSVANLSGLAVARQQALEKAGGGDGAVPGAGVRSTPGPLVAYGSTETHQCVRKAISMLGLGTEGFCPIPVDEDFRIRTNRLREQIRADRGRGKQPFCVIGNAGTVATGAIDPLDELHQIARQEGLWFHIDGAFGALARLVPAYAESLAPLAAADSVAFDLHKWMYMPYEVGCVLIRDAALQRRTFAAPANYLLAHERGLAAGPETYSNQGIELSRGFKALKVWMSLKEHGIRRYAEMIEQNIAQASYLGQLIQACPELELMAPVVMNIVCFRHMGKSGDDQRVREANAGNAASSFNKELLMRLHESGIAAPSYTLIRGQYAIRVAITNHRTQMEDMDVLVRAVLEIGAKIR
jgi:aromatic-L-amino-acid/L-tryptophan decarboxylase